MLINAFKLLEFPVLSLHTGTQIAQVSQVIFDPDKLQIVAFRIESLVNLGDAGDILLVESIREFSRMGMIIDSSDDLASDGEVIRIDKVVKLNFSLEGLKVETKKKAKIGKVLDYIVDSSSWIVQQLIVQRPFLKAFLDPELVISRSQIIEVDDDKVVIKEEKSKSKAKQEPAPTFASNFVNPFRDPEFLGSGNGAGGEAEATKEL